MILVSGSLAFDQIMDFPGKFSDHIMPDKIHMLNVSFLVEKMRKGFGGIAGNIAYSLSLLGTDVSILAAAGKDFESYQDFLKKHNVETKYIRIFFELFSSTAVGIVDGRDNNIWGYHMGADQRSTELTLSTVKEKIDFGIVAPQNPKTMLKLAAEYTKEKIPFMFDGGMQLPWLSSADLLKVFKGAEIIIGNDYEVAVMEKKLKMKSLNEFAKKGKIIITTLGEKGSEIAFRNEKIKVKIAKVKKALDPAGAGDAYRAGFMAGFVRKLPLKTCGQMGSLSSAYTVETFGTTTHSYSKKEFCTRYFANFGEKLAL